LVPLPNGVSAGVTSIGSGSKYQQSTGAGSYRENGSGCKMQGS
jgi:hypothetical protein